MKTATPLVITQIRFLKLYDKCWDANRIGKTLESKYERMCDLLAWAFGNTEEFKDMTEFVVQEGNQFYRVPRSHIMDKSRGWFFRDGCYDLFKDLHSFCTINLKGRNYNSKPTRDNLLSQLLTIKKVIYYCTPKWARSSVYDVPTKEELGSTSFQSIPIVSEPLPPDLVDESTAGPIGT